MRLSPLSQVRSVITGKNRFPVTIRQIQVHKKASRIERPVLALRSGLPAKVELLVSRHLSVRVCRLMVYGFPHSNCFCVVTSASG